MLNVSFAEVASSGLDNLPIVDGQIIVTKDTGEVYRDIGDTRLPLCVPLAIVSSLPLAPISGRLYLLTTDYTLHIFHNGDWRDVGIHI